MNMSEQAKEARREYSRKWRANNRDKQKQYAARHWEKIAEKQRTAEKLVDFTEEKQ